MALKGSDRLLCSCTVLAGDPAVIAVSGKHLLQRLDLLADRAVRERRVMADRMRANIMSDAGRREPIPREIFAGIDLAPRRDVGMSEDARRLNRTAQRNIAAERDHGFDLRFGKRRRTELITAIMNLDSDRGGIHVLRAGPARLAGVPGAARFRHEL